jgi:hypothetical protein
MQILAHASWFVTTKDDLPRQYLDSETISAHRPTNMRQCTTSCLAICIARGSMLGDVLSGGQNL